jgi:uncharacterized protein YjiS (DUF1127 family)
MDISNMDLAFNPRGRRGGLPIHNILVELTVWLQNVAYKHRQRRQIPPPAGMSDHLFRDIGLSRLGRRFDPHGDV